MGVGATPSRVRTRSTAPSGIRWFGHGPGSGYGTAVENYLSALEAAGVPLRWSPLGWPAELWPARLGPILDLTRHGLADARHAGLADQEIEHDTVVVHAPPMWHDELKLLADGRALVAYTTWETDRLPAEWVSILNRYHRVLVPSQFNRDSFRVSGVKVPIEVVPHLVASTLEPPPPTTPSSPSAVAEPELSADGFVFYTIATWTTRKALGDLVMAYLAAFTDRDDVTLVIHTHPEDRIRGHQLGCGGEHNRPPQVSTWFALARLLAGRAHPPRIVLSTRRVSQAAIDRLHAGGDCFVTLSRGEGFGLGPFEAGAMGNPSILTGWGGSLEYLPLGYPYLVAFDLIPTSDDPADEWWAPRVGERWARARHEHAVELMRHVYHHPAEARTWGQRLQRHILERFSARVVVEQLLGALAAA